MTTFIERKFARITIDHEKCTVPFLCKKCLQVCPEAVLYVMRVIEAEERLKEVDPRIDGNYRLSVARRDQCTGCNKCIEVCPVGALRIELPTGEVLEAPADKKKVKGDPFKELREASYPLFAAPRPYSFDLAQDMIDSIREEFGPEGIASRLAEAINGKAMGEVEKIGKEIFEDYGQKWMKRVMQLGEEYSDRTIELVKEAVDHEGNQFLIWPYVLQRFIEIAYLSTQEYPKYLKVPFVVENQWEIAYRVPDCFLFRTIKEKCGDEVANLMTCKNGCLKALETMAEDMEFNTRINMVASTAKDGYCEFSMRKL